MRNLLLTLTIALLLVTTEINAAKKLANHNYYTKQLVGTWELRYNGTAPYHFSQIGFTANGRKCVIAFDFSFNGLLSADYWDNNYQVENNILITEITYSSTPLLKKGLIIKDRIDVLKKNYLEVFMVKPMKGSSPEQHQRLEGVAPEELCKVIDNYRAAMTD